MLTIPLGHTLAALRDVLGDITELSSRLVHRRVQVRALDTGEWLPMSSPDQVLINGVLASGAPISIHYRGGAPRGGVGFEWYIQGTDGDIRVTAASGHTQVVQLSLEGARAEERTLHPLAIPTGSQAGWPADVIVGNVARMYARLAADLENGTRTAPNFDDAVELHRLIAAIETASDHGGRVEPKATNRPLPLQ